MSTLNTVNGLVNKDNNLQRDSTQNEKQTPLVKNNSSSQIWGLSYMISGRRKGVFGVDLHTNMYNVHDFFVKINLQFRSILNNF